MSKSKNNKIERHNKLRMLIQEHPFLNDKQLADSLSVSVPTIRLDRIELAIPELRERMRKIADEQLDKVKSIDIKEVIGEVVEIELGCRALSLFEVKREHVLKKTQVARGHYLFAQANSLAVALIDADVVLTASANVKFLRPVKLGDKCIAKAEVLDKVLNVTNKKDVYNILVTTKVNNNIVFTGDYKVAIHI